MPDTRPFRREPDFAVTSVSYDWSKFREKLKKAPRAKNLAKFVGVVSIGGDALKDSEDLYAS